MHDLYLTEHLPKIKAWVSQYINAQIEIVPNKEQINGKLGQSMWGDKTEPPIILFPELITAAEIYDSITALSMRGHICSQPRLYEHANEINSSIKYLEHLVLHEVAHIKNNWPQDYETECDLWVYEQMHK